MKSDRSFEILQLFTEGILKTREATAASVFSAFYPQAERKPFRFAGTD
jgi:hypothetical protein